MVSRTLNVNELNWDGELVITRLLKCCKPGLAYQIQYSNHIWGSAAILPTTRKLEFCRFFFVIRARCPQMASDTPFIIHFYPNDGVGGSGFSIPHPYRDGMINIKTLKNNALGVRGAEASDFVWTILLRIEVATTGSTVAEISDAGALSKTSPVAEFNLEHKVFEASAPQLLSAMHCCRVQDYIDITVTTSWADVSRREPITLDRDGRIME